MSTAAPPSFLQRSLRFASILAKAAAVFATVEAISYGGIHYVLASRAPGLFYEPPNFATSRRLFKGYLEWRHPILGWPSPESIGMEVAELTILL